MAKEFECDSDGVIIPEADDDEKARPKRREGGVTVGDGLVLHLKRILPARRAAVYRALSDPGELARWWGPPGFTAPSVELTGTTGRAPGAPASYEQRQATQEVSK